MIHCRGLRVRLGDHLALDGVDWDLPRGASAAIVGPNGAGKSTLLRALLGLVPIAEGTVAVCGAAPGAMPRCVAYVPQVKTLDRRFPALPTELVASGFAGRWPWRRRHRRRAEALLERVGLGDRRNRPLAALSGGELQRVYLARALAREPELICLDEPATGLDLAATGDLYQILDDEQARRGTTIAMVTHDWGAAQHHVDQVLILNRRVIADGAPDAVLTEHALSQAFGHLGHHHHMHPGPCAHD